MVFQKYSSNSNYEIASDYLKSQEGFREIISNKDVRMYIDTNTGNVFSVSPDHIRIPTEIHPNNEQIKNRLLIIIGAQNKND